MNEMEILRKLVAVGAKECNVEVPRALALLERLTGSTKPGENKLFFYTLAAILGQNAKTKYTTARANKLRLRLKTYSKDDMMKAATAIANDDYMMGSNGRKYGTIDYLIRNDEQIDTWLDNAIAAKAAKSKANHALSNKVPEAITKATEVKRADPAAVAAARAKFNAKMNRK